MSAASGCCPNNPISKYPQGLRICMRCTSTYYVHYMNMDRCGWLCTLFFCVCIRHAGLHSYWRFGYWVIEKSTKLPFRRIEQKDIRENGEKTQRINKGMRQVVSVDDAACRDGKRTGERQATDADQIFSLCAVRCVVVAPSLSALIRNRLDTTKDEHQQR